MGKYSKTRLIAIDNGNLLTIKEANHGLFEIIEKVSAQQFLIEFYNEANKLVQHFKDYYNGQLFSDKYHEDIHAEFIDFLPLKYDILNEFEAGISIGQLDDYKDIIKIIASKNKEITDTDKIQIIANSFDHNLQVISKIGYLKDGTLLIAYEPTNIESLIIIVSMLLFANKEINLNFCHNCHKAFIPSRNDALYCSTKCKRLYNEANNKNLISKAYTSYRTYLCAYANDNNVQDKNIYNEFDEWKNVVKRETNVLKQEFKVLNKKNSIKHTKKNDAELIQMVDSYKSYIRKEWAKIHGKNK